MFNRKDIDFKESPNHSSRNNTKIQLIVLHWTGGSFNGSILWMGMKESAVSAHYCISEQGKIIQLVKEEDKAWHAGKSFLEGYGDNLNNCSLGIELEGPCSDRDWNEWPKTMLDACVDLCKDILKRYPNIKITDHSSICMPRGRKTDVKKGTGVNVFPWDYILKETNIEEA